MIVALLVLAAAVAEAPAAVITLEGNGVFGPENCFPFGGRVPFATQTTYTGFIYKNVPPFNLTPGSRMAFDLGAPNDQPITVDIALAVTTSNGASTPGTGFTTVVSAGTPLDPDGDATIGDYELEFTVDTPFVFPGGGLIIRFLAVGAYASDTTCTQVLMSSEGEDPAGFFVGRFYFDVDGDYPWDSEDSNYIGVVRFTLPCGDGTLDPGEQCDDGNVDAGDCCAPNCTYEPTSTACADDGFACTADRCDGAGTCTHGRYTDCRTAGRSSLLMKQDGGIRDRLTWKWTKGETVTLVELGNPAGIATYSLCVYAGTASAPIAIATVPPSLTKWQQLGPAGYAFSDPTGADSGVRKMVLKPSNQNRTKAVLKGAGVNLPDPALGNLALPVVGQLINGSSGLCLEGRYESADVISNDAEKFKARAK